MEKRARVKVTDFVGLDAWPLAAVRAVAEALQSSIRPRGAGQSAVRGSGAQSRRRPSFSSEARHGSELARAVQGCPGRGRVQVVDGRPWRRLDGTRARRPWSLEATDLAVAEAVVAEGEHAPGDRDLGDLAAAALRDPFEGGAEWTAAGCCLLCRFDQGPADVRRALPGDVPEAGAAVGADGRCQAGPGAEVASAERKRSISPTSAISSIAV
jgi:hypothetical protein